MSSLSSDEFSDSYFEAFTTEDFEKVDGTVNAALEKTQDTSLDMGVQVANMSFQSEICGLNLTLLSSQELAQLCDATDTEEDVAVGGGTKTADASFQSDTFDLNFRTLTEKDLAKIDAVVSQSGLAASGGPLIKIELETEPPIVEEGPFVDSVPSEKLERALIRPPIKQFRWKNILSVTDLVSPSWCEVQYDYGLRGKRNRPITERPKSFNSAAGKPIMVEERVSKKNDVRTKQGLAIHKELQREIKFEELKVDVTSEESRWALRLANMIACLQELAFNGNIVREMPVFGVLHDQVVVGIVDEIVREVVVQSSPKKGTKRSSQSSSQSRSSKRARVSQPPSQQDLETFFNPKVKRTLNEDCGPAVSYPEPAQEFKVTSLRLSDAKTRQKNWLPSDDDAHQGRLQLSIYYRLLSELLATDPPYDFQPIWEKMNIDSTADLPTIFLVQCRILHESELQTVTLDDLVVSWHKLVKDAEIGHVNPTLELVYYRRPADDEKGKGKAALSSVQERGLSQDDDDLAKAIAASLEEAGTSGLVASTSKPATSVPAAHTEGPSDSVDIALQWALQQSLEHNAVPVDTHANEALLADGRVVGTEDNAEGIRRFPKIGSKSFLYDKLRTDEHIKHILRWWRGERQPEGVPLARVHRCRTCEYENDCEWRAAKALELRKKGQK